MPLIYAVMGAVLGGWLMDGGDYLFGLFGGAFGGYLLGRIRSLQSALDRLQQDSATKTTGKATRQVPLASPGAARTAAASHETPAPRAAAAGDGAAAASPAGRPSRRVARAPTGPGSDLAGKAWRAARRWITTGNVPVKVGVIISFFGVAFLLKYTVDRNLLVFPIELRLVAIAAVACGILAVGWRLRASHSVYALSLQGGGIGILYLTIFAAFRLYALLPGSLAFLLLVTLTVAVGLLAVLQEAVALAVLAIVGGFLAPVLASTGQGSHVGLFSYYLLLNAAVLGISWFRAWRVLNLVGFVFTFGIATLWGYEYYRPALYASTQPFLILFFLFYQAIAVLFAFRQEPALRGIVDGSILFGTPVVSFALQSRLVSNTEYGLAISAVVVAIFYLFLATWLFRNHRAQLRLMIESYTALAVAFATIAVPLALDARWTAAAWSLEGAALVWVGVRQGGLLARATGFALLFAGGGAFLEAGWQHNVGWPVLNGNFLGGLLIACAGFFAAHCLQRDSQPLPKQAVGVWLLLGWSLLWWLGTGGLEIDDRASHESRISLYLLFVAGSLAGLAQLAKRLAWRAAGQLSLVYILLFALLALLFTGQHHHWLVGWGWLAWPAALAAHLFILRRSIAFNERHQGLWHLAGLLLFATGFAQDAAWRVHDAGLNDTWAVSAGWLLLLGISIGLPPLRRHVAWPVRAFWPHYLGGGALLMAFVLVTLVSMGLDQPGNPAPLRYLPVLNPFDAITLLALLIAAQLLRQMRTDDLIVTSSQWPVAKFSWAALAFVLSTIAVVRGVHHFDEVRWSGEQLARSVSVQAALSIYWGILGFAGMVFGTRRAERTLWLVGTATMSLVVIKLFLIDLGNTGTVARIVSFLGVGALLLVVGYFAPAPPRRAGASAEVEN